MRLDELSLDSLREELPLLGAPMRIALILFTWFLLGILSFFLFWSSSLGMNQQLETDIQQSLSRLESQSILLLEATAIEAELAALEAQLPVLKMALPSDRELASLLGRINEMILDKQLKLSEFTPQPSINKEVMRIVPVKVSVRGQGDAISRLPNHIASLSRQVSLKEFEMQVQPESGDWQMVGELNAYAQLPTNQVGTASPVPEEESRND
ncbi:type 4a pilus biogenesis protein PilO [Limnobacter parvus]|uniref:Type 4a pilus biogenesis protein PilO n=1 Tax=Limnobacter parvus TaxID=2939690 RepID=A0ABT1XGB5_9BURK|nr:type 4a pilus biogenesis protein PilO [Limnobacter parvus]MCR2745944.1 type 4a pilus biogenesis protein PilO [Limnobacter parvus]